MNLKKYLRIVVDIYISNKMWIKVDKSRNLCNIDSPLYMKILHDKLTEKYKLDQNYLVNKIIKYSYIFRNKIIL